MIYPYLIRTGCGERRGHPITMRVLERIQIGTMAFSGEAVRINIIMTCALGTVDRQSTYMYIEYTSLHKGHIEEGWE